MPINERSSKSQVGSDWEPQCSSYQLCWGGPFLITPAQSDMRSVSDIYVSYCTFFIRLLAMFPVWLWIPPSLASSELTTKWDVEFFVCWKVYVRPSCCIDFITFDVCLLSNVLQRYWLYHCDHSRVLTKTHDFWCWFLVLKLMELWALLSSHRLPLLKRPQLCHSLAVYLSERPTKILTTLSS